MITTKEFWFTRLDLVEDQSDGNLPIKNLKYPNAHLNSIYIASFTENEKEEYPLWKLYNALDGVRFCINSELFGSKVSNSDKIILDKDCSIGFSYFGEDHLSFKPQYIYGPVKITYYKSNELDRLTNDIQSSNSFEIKFRNLIFAKSELYSYEKEYRYVIGPEINTIITNETSYRLNEDLNKDQPYLSIPMKLKIQEVMFGPKCTNLDGIINLLKEYNPEITIKYSEIKLRNCKY